jgi:hypothetical protein
MSPHFHRSGKRDAIVSCVTPVFSILKTTLEIFLKRLSQVAAPKSGQEAIDAFSSYDHRRLGASAPSVFIDGLLHGAGADAAAAFPADPSKTRISIAFRC